MKGNIKSVTKGKEHTINLAMDIRSREAALKRRNDELDACQTLYGNDDTTPSTCIQDQSFDTPLLSRQSSAQDVGSNKSHVDLIPAKTTLRVSYYKKS